MDSTYSIEFLPWGSADAKNAQVIHWDNGEKHVVVAGLTKVEALDKCLALKAAERRAEELEIMRSRGEI